MYRFAPVTVDHAGDFPGPPGAAGTSLAELGTWLGGDSDLGHGEALLD
jgi:hypothetical protein